ncbi:hypothetical protein CC2G_005562 [Coprinopsis cinerea AmutBmut pab1-1]|nr:hypothetical protein CC2G_005562 [Coprinopsis cinerea AmutBmut pab1-1]
MSVGGPDEGEEESAARPRACMGRARSCYGYPFRTSSLLPFAQDIKAPFVRSKTSLFGVNSSQRSPI